MTRLLDIATAPRAASKTWTLGTTTWREVCAWALDPRDGAKDGPGFVLGKLNSTRRAKDTIESRCGLALDADHLNPHTRDELLARLRALGCAVVVYSTYSSTAAAPRLRVLVLADRPVSPEEYRVVVRWLMEQLGNEIFDRTCDQPERFMYMPTQPADGEYFVEVMGGEPYDIDEALLRADLAIHTSPVLGEVGAAEPTGNVILTPHALPEGVVRAAVAWALQQLDRLASLADADRLVWPGFPDGVGWDKGSWLAAQRLVEAANSSPEYPLAQAQADFFAHAPGAIGTYDPSYKWASAVEATGDRTLPYDDPGSVFSPVSPAVERFLRLSLRDLLNPNRPPREWVVEGLLLAGTSNAFIAPAGHRKSLVLLSSALAVARGDTDWAGLAIPRARRCLYVDMENTEDDLRDRLISFGVSDDVPNFVLLSMPGLKPLDTMVGGTEFLRAVDAFGLESGDLVVLDSYQRITEAGENDSDTTRAFYRHTGMGLKQRGLTVVRTDNTGKDATRGARGSSGKRDDVDVEYLIKSTGDLIEFTPGKVRQGGIAAQTFCVTTQDGRTTFLNSQGTVHQADVASCIAWLDEHEVDRSAGANRVVELVREGDRLLFPRAVVREAVRLRKERSEDFE